MFKRKILGDGGWLLAAFLGLVSRLGFAPFDCWWVVWPLLSALTYLVLSAPSASRAGALLFSWWWGLFFSSFYWLGYSVNHYGGIPAFFAYLLIGVLGIVLAFPAWVAGCLAWRFCHRTRQGSDFYTYLLWWPLIFWSLELGMGYFGECGWLSLAYTHLNGPFIGLASLIGSVGLSFFIIQHISLTIYGCGLIFLKRVAWPKVVAAYLVYTGALWLVSTAFVPKQVDFLAVPTKTIRIVQLAATPDAKWSVTGQAKLTQQYWQNSGFAESGGEGDLVVVWPEAAIAQVIDLKSAEWRKIKKRLADARTTLIAGGLLTAKDGVSNGIVAVGGVHGDGNKTGGESVYHKRRLLPFGEYLPMRNSFLGGWIARWVPFSDLQAGSFDQPPMMVGGVKVASAICSEIAHSYLLWPQIPSARLIVSLADDSWFGLNGPAGWQHLAVARMRSIELGMYQVWANNSGPSAIIGSQGQIIAQIPARGVGTVQATVPLSGCKTVYGGLGLAIWRRMKEFRRP